MTISEFQNFLILAKHGSFTKAAGSIYISQQALSKSIAHLECSLGVPLFVRRYHHLALTEEGQQLYDFLSNAEAGFNALLSSFSQGIDESPQILKVGYAVLLDMSEYMSRQMRTFRDGKNLPSLVVERLETALVPEKLLNGELDICFCYPDFHPSPWIDSFPIQRYELFLCISKSHSAAQPGKSYADYFGETIFEAQGYEKLGLHNRAGRYRHVLMDVAERDGLPKRELSIQVVPTLESMIAAVENGLGIAIVPGSNPMAQSKTILSYPLGYNSSVYCVYNKTSKNPLVSAFICHIKSRLDK